MSAHHWRLTIAATIFAIGSTMAADAVELNPAEIDGVIAYRDSPDGRWLPRRPEYPHEHHGD